MKKETKNFIWFWIITLLWVFTSGPLVEIANTIPILKPIGGILYIIGTTILWFIYGVGSCCKEKEEEDG